MWLPTAHWTQPPAPLARRCRPQQAALDKAKELASAPRLASGDYGDLVRLLRKILQKDSMIAVAAAAADVAAALAQGLRAEFSAHAKVRAGGGVAARAKAYARRHAHEEDKSHEFQLW